MEIFIKDIGLTTKNTERVELNIIILVNLQTSIIEFNRNFNEKTNYFKGEWYQGDYNNSERTGYGEHHYAFSRNNLFALIILFYFINKYFIF
jgi:hypothetical protein